MSNIKYKVSKSKNIQINLCLLSSKDPLTKILNIIYLLVFIVEFVAFILVLYLKLSN